MVNRSMYQGFLCLARSMNSNFPPRFIDTTRAASSHSTFLATRFGDFRVTSGHPFILLLMHRKGGMLGNSKDFGVSENAQVISSEYVKTYFYPKCNYPEGFWGGQGTLVLLENMETSISCNEIEVSSAFSNDLPCNSLVPHRHTVIISGPLLMLRQMAESASPSTSSPSGALSGVI